MNHMPVKYKRERMGLRESPWWRSEKQKRHVRSFACTVMGLEDHVCSGPRVAAHVRQWTDGAKDEKPSDFFCFPLCDAAHREQHQHGEPAFERKYRRDSLSVCSHMIKTSPVKAEILEWGRERKPRGWELLRL